MSMMRDSHVLELDSQRELLERLQLLTRFGSNLITITGTQGAGKTWLAQRYLEVWAPDKNQSLLMCFANQDDAQRRLTILSQLVSEPLFNPADSLIDSFIHLMDGEACDVVIAIDDAHLLSETLLSELWMLVLESQQNALWTVNVVLFTRTGADEGLENQLARLSYGQEQKPIELEIESFSQQEADRFFEQLVIRFVEDDLEKRVRNAYRTVARRPGDIMALGDYKVEKRIIIRSIVGSPLNIALIVLALLLLIGGGYWWMMSQPSPDDKAQQITQSSEQTVIPTLPEDNADALGVISPEEVVDPSLANADDDTEALPPAVTEEVTSVGDSNKEHQRVVITSEVVDALLEEKPEEADTSEIEKVVEESVPPQPQAQPATTAVDEALVKPVIQFSFAKEQLLSFSARSYTLQLAAVNELEDVQAFLDRYQLSEKVYIYPTVRNDVDWYIVTYDNFPTIQAARDAVSSLSADLQKLEPWAKSLSQVHRELERGK